ncbi:tyrosine-protein phosphatase [Kordiimonas lacus]|uniref:Protein-tyrosine phosphatase n=1 Tax=Kordiimonas lacus TaxID=637679 RepID=A0A1G6ZRS9_9PROT|nr:tyrosine-protein phosphatase [Kordiimonas lacus]SDE05221.1 protein-tyrosine phosphatase [Kordiimonas lacus]
MPTPPRIIPMPGVKNFRDMGGYKVADGRTMRWDKLYRSGHWAEFTGTPETAAPAYGITTVIDFRSDVEKKRHPVGWPDGWAPAYHATPIGGNAAAWVQDLYERLSTSPFPAKELRDQFILAFETIPVANADGLKRFFDIILEGKPEDKVLFHCTAGKDRTGIAGALLMRALGASEPDITADFLMTNDAVDLPATSAMIAERLSEKAGRAIVPDDVHPLVGVEPAFLDAAYASIERATGSVDAYLEDTLGLTPARQARLRDLFLEG